MSVRNVDQHTQQALQFPVKGKDSPCEQTVAKAEASENATCNSQQPGATAEHQPSRSSTCSMVRIEVSSSRPDHLGTIGSQNVRTFSTVKSHFCCLSGRCRQCYSDFLLQCAGKIEADHTDSGLVMDCADRNREAP